MKDRRDAVLVVEPHPDLAVLMERWLQRLDMRVVVCTEAAELESTLAGQSFSLAITDLTTPGSLGIHAAMALRNAGFSGRLIGWVTYSDPYVTYRCLELGYSELLAKPLTFAELRQSLQLASVA